MERKADRTWPSKNEHANDGSYACVESNVLENIMIQTINGLQSYRALLALLRYHKAIYKGLSFTHR